MQRWVWANLAGILLGLLCQVATAREAGGPTYEGRLQRRREEVSRKARSDELRFERARLRAQQRLEQEALNERMGYSPSRPYTNTAKWAMWQGQR
jgi:hypothetical protein